MRMRSTLAKALIFLAIAVILTASVVYIAFQASPWPSALLVRYAFSKGGAEIARALEKHVPPGVAAIRDLSYDPADGDALLDVFAPASFEAGPPLPLVVWIHGGGWVAGSKDEIANYARILASKGYVVAGVNYTRAPAATFPTPMRQVNAALAYLVGNAARLRIDPQRIVLAGDSAGAHIAAVVANTIAVPEYARVIGVKPSVARARIAGVVLFCGPYTVEGVAFDGPFGGFLRTALWSFSGRQDFLSDPGFANAWVLNFVTADFPPAFISAGNGDPLAPQSVALADALAARGVPVTRLFFAADHAPALPHEYQFNLDTAEGRQALDAMLGFLKSATAPK